MTLKARFRHFLEADPQRLHFAAHSHHAWPDVTRLAQQRCWEDAARLADNKWQKVFGEIIPNAQGHLAQILNLSDPGAIAFGPNTHGFLVRLLSCLPQGRPIRVLTTDGEFHSFTRQMRRLAEEDLARLEIVPVEPRTSFAERFGNAAAAGGHDLVYFSQVFYDSGYAVSDPAALVAAVADADSLVVVDGYHAFLALPSDLAASETRAFYLAGGYKYAMAGEGVAFLQAPATQAPRPRDTGWYAAFGALEKPDDGSVGFAADGSRFLGATFDPAGLYRLNAVFDWLAAESITVETIHAHAHNLQRRFVKALAGLGLEALHPGQLAVPIEEPARGNFLSFHTPEAEKIHARLMAAKVVTDYRGERLRFGFGLYQDEDDVDRVCRRLSDLLA